MAVESIKCKEEHKILIINNNIKDKEFAIWAKSEKAEHCKILNNPKNKGVAGSWNQIVKWAIKGKDAELIFILNDDIILHPDCLDRMLETVRTKKYGAISATSVQGSFRRMVKLTEDVFPRYASVGMHFSCFALTPKTLVKVGLFDEKFRLSYVEDTDYFYRLEQAKTKKGCDRHAWFVHYQVMNRKTPNITSRRKAHRTNRNYFKKKWKKNPRVIFNRKRKGTKI